MGIKKNLTIFVAFVLVAVIAAAPLFADEETEVERQLKAAIYNTYGVKIYDHAASGGVVWPEKYLRAIIEVFRDMPESFTSCTRALYLDSSIEQFEIKYNGYNEEYGIIQVGLGAFWPSPAYYKRFMELHDGNKPSGSDIMNRFKTMLVRGMTYCFLQENTDDFGRSDLMQSYRSVYFSNPKFSTKIYTPGDENFMVVAPGKNHLWVDLAFAVAHYCTDASGFRSSYPKRYNFVREKLFDGNGVDGWPEKWLDGTGQTSGGDGHTGSYIDTETSTDANTDTVTSTNTDTGSSTGTDTGTSTDTNTGSNTDTNTSTDTGTDTGVYIPPLEDRPDIPEISEGDYYPVVSQVDTGAAASFLSEHPEWKSMPNGMKRAIKEVFDQLPKYFTTCTRGISYMPTTDTADAFQSESYIFVTQNSWYAPSYAELDDDLRAKRFKQTLVREMTKCFLYYHRSKITRWRGAIGASITDAEAEVDIVESTVLYYADQSYLEKLHALKWSFIKNNIFSNN